MLLSAQQLKSLYAGRRGCTYPHIQHSSSSAILNIPYVFARIIVNPRYFGVKIESSEKMK